VLCAPAPRPVAARRPLPLFQRGAGQTVRRCGREGGARLPSIGAEPHAWSALHTSLQARSLCVDKHHEIRRRGLVYKTYMYVLFRRLIGFNLTKRRISG
jgi:hypothetical protein